MTTNALPASILSSFITRLGQNPESESEEDEAARRLLQTNVAATFLELTTDDYVDVTVKEATPDETTSAAPGSVDGPRIRRRGL